MLYARRPFVYCTDLSGTSRPHRTLCLEDWAINALMNIRVMVMSREAQGQIKMLQGEIAALNKQLAASNAASAMYSGGVNNAIRSSVKWGTQLQYLGRQLTYNFSAPILLAAGFATKWALDNEKAMTRVRKVYGDGNMSARQLASETNALKGSFEALSQPVRCNAGRHN